MNQSKLTPVFRVKGRFLYDPCGHPVILRGVNKMNIWTDPQGASFTEIAQTGANCVRIVWLAFLDGQPTSAADLDNIISACIAQKMIPLVEVHDATGDWSQLPVALAFWQRADIVAVVKKHERYLLVNIANEAGNYTVTDEQYIQDYSAAVKDLREVGIRTPLVIDGADWGKNLEQIVRVAPQLIKADPDQNILFSVHTYWPIKDGADADFIRNQFQTAVDQNVPFMVGEFSKYGAYINKDINPCSDDGRIDYQTILSECQRLQIGWLAWEWGPGNASDNNPLCEKMDMTTQSTFATLKDWGLEIAVTRPDSILHTAQRPPFILNGLQCP